MILKVEYFLKKIAILMIEIIIICWIAVDVQNKAFSID